MEEQGCEPFFHKSGFLETDSDLFYGHLAYLKTLCNSPGTNFSVSCLTTTEYIPPEYS